MDDPRPTDRPQVQADKAKAGKKPSLLADEGEDGEDLVFVQVALARIPERASPKPVPIKLPVPLYRAGKDDHAICVIVKEADKGKVKRALAALRLDGVSEVVGLQELRTDYKDYQERRKLRDGASSRHVVKQKLVGVGVGREGGATVCAAPSWLVLVSCL